MTAKDGEKLRSQRDLWKHSREERSSRFHRLMGVCSVAFSIYTLVHFLGDHPTAAKLHGIAACATLILWFLGWKNKSLIVPLSHCNLLVALLTLSIHSWNGALLNDSAWFLALIPLLAAYQLGSRQAAIWTIIVVFVLLLLPFLAATFRPDPEWTLSQAEVNRNRVLLVVIMSALGIATAKGRQEEWRRAQKWAERLKVSNSNLTALNDALKQSNSDLESMASILCHDLKAPLRGILISLQILDDSMQELEEDDAELFQNVQDSARRMNELIEALHEYSQATAILDSNKSTVSLDEIVSQVLLDLGPELERSRASIDTEAELGSVSGHSALLRQLFQNLISNAIKFQPAGRKPNVKIGKKADETYFVRDNGIGMDQKFLSRVFKLYNRGAIKEEYEGSGVGLSICARVVSQHYGKIWIESEELEGSTVFFTLGSQPEAQATTQDLK